MENNMQKKVLQGSTCLSSQEANQTSNKSTIPFLEDVIHRLNTELESLRYNRTILQNMMNKTNGDFSYINLENESQFSDSGGDKPKVLVEVINDLFSELNNENYKLSQVVYSLEKITGR